MTRGDPQDLKRTSELLKALGSQTRLGIILALADSPLCVHDLTERLGISQSATSQHLRVLRHLRLVSASRRGREMFYELTDAHVGRIVEDALHHSRERIEHR